MATAGSLRSRLLSTGALALSALALQVPSAGTALGAPSLVKDINPGAGHSFPDSLVNVNGTLFFGANDGARGRELWKSNGTSADTVFIADLFPGATFTARAADAS
jgi:ELWxxDGT repeat protein